MLFIGSQDVTPSVKGSTAFYIGSNFIGPMVQVVNNKKPYYNWKCPGEMSYVQNSSLFYYYNKGQKTNSIISACYGNGMYVVLLLMDNKLAYSSDGINWTETATAPTILTHDNKNLGRKKIIFFNDKFYIYGYKDYYDSEKDESYTLFSFSYSADLINWTPLSNEIRFEGYSDGISFINNKFIFVTCDDNGVGYYYSSNDLTNWSYIRSNGKYHWGSWDGVTYGNGVYIVANSGTSQYYYSTDLINWTTYKNTVKSGQFIDSCYFLNNKFVFLRNDGNNKIHTSEDGINWTEVNLGFSFGEIYSAGVVNGTLYMECYENDKYVLHYTSDLENWNIFQDIPMLYNEQLVPTPQGFIVSKFENDSRGNAYVYTFFTNDDLCYTLTETPDTSSVVFSEPGTASQLSITSVSQSSITLSDEKVYDRNPTGDTIA